jgi:hypothetical protein
MERFGVEKHRRWCATGYSQSTEPPYPSLASVFVAVNGIHLTISQQVTMMLTLMLASKGVGVPRGALVVLAVADSVQTSARRCVILPRIDQIMDMAAGGKCHGQLSRPRGRALGRRVRRRSHADVLDDAEGHLMRVAITGAKGSSAPLSQECQSTRRCDGARSVGARCP